MICAIIYGDHGRVLFGDWRWLAGILCWWYLLCNKMQGVCLWVVCACAWSLLQMLVLLLYVFFCLIIIICRACEGWRSMKVPRQHITATSISLLVWKLGKNTCCISMLGNLFMSPLAFFLFSSRIPIFASCCSTFLSSDSFFNVILLVI